MGRLLRGVRAGEAGLISNHPAIASAATISLTSSAFAPGGVIPLRYAGHGVGQNVSPALAWDGVPDRAAELVLVMEDPDAPLPRPFVHLIATGLSAASPGLAEGALSSPADGILIGRNTFRRAAYAGPRALSNHGPHRYVFQLFALDRKLDFGRPPTRADLVRAISGGVMAHGRLVGMFERK
jgi:Raf kinase inhibitor-like YbhB/YbcL family protein